VALLEHAEDPWGRDVLLHVGGSLIWVAVGGALLFVVGHALYLSFLARPRRFEGEAHAGSAPPRIPRHSLAARSFHWVMAAALLTSLATAFLPKVGVRFAWVTVHWLAGIALTASVLYHVVHASFWLDFRSIWPDRVDLEDAGRRTRRALGWAAPPPRRFAKYPMENKLYHLAVLVAGLSAIASGLLMLARVRTPFFPRNPFLLGDRAWGFTYAVHGLAGVGFILLVAVHVYFGLRPEKRPITRSMISGWMSRDFYLEEHDPARWPVEAPEPPPGPGREKA